MVTADEVYNATGINIAERTGKTPQQVQIFLDGITDDIKLFVADYAMGGMAQVEWYLKDDRYVEVFKKAIIKQVEYLDANNYVQADLIANAEEANKYAEIGHKAYKELASNGLLYTGAWRL